MLLLLFLGAHPATLGISRPLGIGIFLSLSADVGWRLASAMWSMAFSSLRLRNLAESAGRSYSYDGKPVLDLHSLFLNRRNASRDVSRDASNIFCRV